MKSKFVTEKQKTKEIGFDCVTFNEEKHNEKREWMIF